MVVAEYGKIMTVRSRFYRRLFWPGAILVAVFVIGTVGFWFIGGGRYSIVDALYMTFITVATIGFGEVIDLSGNPAGRAFTMLIAISGIGTFMYVLTNVTALTVEGELTEFFRRRRMEKTARKYYDHYIICGLGSVGLHIVNELKATKRQYVVVDADRNIIAKLLELHPEAVVIEGDATDNTTLLTAGIERARGLFAVTEDDNQNLVISLTARQLNSRLRVVAQCTEMGNSEKMKKAGADAVVCPSLIGGLRMASEMIRPTTVSFLDIMLRDRDRNLRVEEVEVPESCAGKAISALNLKRYPHALLLAAKTGEGWVYNPPEDYVLMPQSTLVFMTTPEGREELEASFETVSGTTDVQT